jgi:hypothetical protein
MLDTFSPETLAPLFLLNQTATKWLPLLLFFLLPIWKELYKRLLDINLTPFRTRYIIKATFSYRNGEFLLSDCSNSFKAVMYDISTKLQQSKNVKYVVYDANFDSFKMVEFTNFFSVTDNIRVTLDKLVENIDKREHNYKVEKFTLSLYPRHNNMELVKEYLETARKDYQSYTTLKALNQQKIFVLDNFDRNFPNFTQLNFESNKTFNNLFFEGKEALITKLDFFLNNKNTYHTLGIPYTMGMLFHGEPGTGKTSTIKAIANYTNRHIVILSTKYIKTYNQLKECLLGEFIHEYRIPYDKRLYVIEELDCSGWESIICRREEKGGDGNGMVKSPSKELELAAAVKLLEGDSGVGKEDTASAAMSLLKKNELSITLSELLELLDGIIEMPGRMIVFTTNHPDKLDPALIRPGRIDVNICFKKLNREDVNRLYRLWFNEELCLDKVKDYEYTQASLGELFSFHGRDARGIIEGDNGRIKND